MSERGFPGNPSPVGKPSITVRHAATSKGKLECHTGHGTEIGPTQAARSFTGKAAASGATSKGGLPHYTGHGTEYGQTSSRG
jgi:hypothetical protein